MQVQKLIVKAQSKNFITKEAIGVLQDQYLLHWNNDFVKTGKEYSYISSQLSAGALSLFNELIFGYMDFYNKLTTLDGVPLTREDMTSLINIKSAKKSRRIYEVLVELREHGVIAELKTQNIVSYIVNPAIACRSSKVNYTLLNLFADYKLHTMDNKKIREVYDLSAGDKLDQSQKSDEELYGSFKQEQEDEYEQAELGEDAQVI